MLYDVAIIGAGVIGTSIARELSKYKLKIALLEKETEPAFGVSKSNSGIIHPGTQNPSGSLKARLCVQGNILTRRIAKELGVDFKEVGELIVIFNEEEMPRLLELKSEAEKIGVPGLRIVDRQWLIENEPNLSGEICAALYAPTAGIVSPYRLVYDLYENALRNGVEAFMETKVEGILGAMPGFELGTSKGAFKARYLVNAAGLFADEISKMAGIDNFRITPRKGEEFILDKKREHLMNHLIFPLPTRRTKGVLIIKTSDGNPMIGPTADDIEDKEDLSTTDEGFKRVLSSAQRMVPSINENDIIAYFAGLRPIAGDDFIIRHENIAPGFVNVAGIQSPGLTAAPAIALMVSGLLKEAGMRFKRKIIFHGHRKKTIHLFAIPFSKTRRLIEKKVKKVTVTKSDSHFFSSDSHFFSFGDIVCRCELVSAREVRDAILRGAKTMDGIKFRTRAQAGRCHGTFCTTRLMKILAEELNMPLTAVTKRGKGSELVKDSRECPITKSE